MQHVVSETGIHTVMAREVRRWIDCAFNTNIQNLWGASEAMDSASGLLINTNMRGQ